MISGLHQQAVVSIEKPEKGKRELMAQNDIGIDLGTTTIIIAQEGKGVVLNQPSVVAMDTRKNTVLEAGDKALAMVGRTPNYISAIFPLKDGVISDHTMTRELICRFVKQVYSSHMVKPRVAVCVPAAITGIESDAVVEAVVAAGARQVYLIDEPIAAALGSGIDITLPDGRMIIDIGGGTTNVVLFEDGETLARGCLDIGGRLICMNPQGIITKVSPAAAVMAQAAGVSVSVGDRCDELKLTAVTRQMAAALNAYLGVGTKDIDAILSQIITP